MSESVQDALSRVFGFGEFRPNQEGIVEALLAKNDVFAVMPTGGGKSLCYQLPAQMLEGYCVVVSPLISLMKDQVDSAQATGLRAEYLNSTLSASDRRRVFERMAHDDLDLLYVSPERFAMPEFMETLKQSTISVFAIDEAHCISEWGHDFRPDYLSLSKIITEFPDVAVAAFTATATPQVQDDIIDKLSLRKPHLTRASFDRPNLFYQVVPKDDLNMQILSFLRERPNESGIIYRTTRKAVEGTALFLQQQGIRALPYHAGLPDSERKKHQEQFNRDETHVIVATVAFGMGIDKSNVRFVLHGDLPKNVEGYYQETGRAGRDGEPAHCCLFFSQGDTSKIRYFIDQIEDILDKKIAVVQLNKMVDIAQANVCRRRNILSYFGEVYDKENCETCDVCTGDVERMDATVDAQKILSAIYRTGGKFGAVHIADIVAGADTKRIRQFEHHKIKTYGAGSDRDKRHWRRMIDALVSQNCIELSDDKYPVLKLAPKATPILKGQIKFGILLQKKSSKSNTQAISSFSEGLFEVLRDERRRTARDLGLPPFVVFSDHTLHEMARYFPSTPVELRKISGVGESKLEHFGEAFIAAIIAYKEAHPEETKARSILQVPVTSVAKPKKSKGDTVSETFALIKDGLNVAQICTRRNLSPATITQHIQKLIQSGETIDCDQFIAPEARIDIEELFRKTNASSLKAVVDAGKGKVTYEQARLVRAFMQE